jgi:hypothetical protein
MSGRTSAVAAALAVIVFSGVAHADDTTTCVDAFDKGQGLQRANKLVAAHEALLACARPSCPGLVRKDCDDLLLQVESALPSVVISARSGGHDVTDVTVASDGTQIASVLDGRAITLDPGIHQMRFEMKGAPVLEKQVVVREGQKNQPIVVDIEAASKNPVGAPAPSPEPAVDPRAAETAPPSSAPSPAPVDGSHANNLKWAGLAVGAAGVVGVGLGAVFGLMASSKWSSAQSDCPSSTGCAPTSTAYDEKSSAQTSATVSTISFLAGGVLLAGGLTMYLLAPKASSSSTVGIAPSGSGAELFGRF